MDTNDIHSRRGHPLFHIILEELGDLHDKKNYDYTAGTAGGPLSNFHRTSAIMKLYPGMDWDSEFGVALCYMLKQLDAALILRSQRRKSVTGEPIGIRLKDVAIYSIIGMILEAEERNGGNSNDIVGAQRSVSSPAGEVRAPETTHPRETMSSLQQPARSESSQSRERTWKPSPGPSY